MLMTFKTGGDQCRSLQWYQPRVTLTRCALTDDNGEVSPKRGNAITRIGL